MDGQPYSNGINTTSSGQTYPSPTAISPHHLQTGSPLPPTLPPLQPPVAAMQQQQQQSMYGSNPHTPRTPGTPNTPNSTNNLPSYQHQTSQPGGSRPMYSYPHPGYATSAGMMPQGPNAASHPQPIAPAPAGSRAPPVLRPMPPGGIMPQPGAMSSPHFSTSMMPAVSALQEADAPTHVVGSQGRRGILPSAPGRPAAPQAGSGSAKNTVIPVKDADGKFPCPHCTKTYLHAKHLKRHLLRHTGDRPYMCVLCRDTFSRSDILKRHFQKCSIRRGNPTGVSHLSHPQAHVKKNQQAQKASGMGNESDLNQLNGLNNMGGEGMVHPFGMVPVNDGMNNMAGDQHQLSRSSSGSRLDNGNNGDRRNVAGMAPQPYGNDPGPMGGQQMPSYNMPPGQNGMPMYGGSNPNQQSGLDWSQMFQAGAHQPSINIFPPPNLGQTQTATKTEHKLAEPYTTEPSSAHSSTNWGMPSNVQDPYTKLSDNILNFLNPPSQTIAPHLAGMNLYFSPDNIKDFLDKYTHFHVHTPVLHVPTFRIMQAYTGLLTAMCCIGACYSDRAEASNVREMMDFLWLALERSCPLLAKKGHNDKGPQPAARIDTEHLSAILITGILTLWNGTPQQRARARRTFSLLAIQVRRLNLLTLSQDPSLYSPLHQANFDSASYSVKEFSWPEWIEQERRVRVVLGIFLGDVAMGMYFNISPRLDPMELHIPLPCDDAAWDAENVYDCLAALGVHGVDAAREKNPYGTQRATQPEVHWALQALLHPSLQIQPDSTNLYGKFVLIHAIMTIIRSALIDGNSRPVRDYGTPPPNDWLTPNGAQSGIATPVNGAGSDMDPQSLKAASVALDKFKHNWDVDMVTQFPPILPNTNNFRRHGFSRDAIHFYWLAKYLLKHTSPSDLKLAPDARFMQVMHILKSLRTWVMTDGASRGEELGSIGEIDEEYGTMDLTLDMAKLFKPLPQVVGDGEQVSVKTALNTMGGKSD